VRLSRDDFPAFSGIFLVAAHAILNARRFQKTIRNQGRRTIKMF